MKISLSKAIIGVALSSLVMGCQTTSVTYSTKPVIGSDTRSAVEKTIINKDNTNPCPLLLPPFITLLFYPTLLMQRIYPVVTGRYVVQDNCLKFEQIYNNKTRLLTPLFDPTYKVSLLQNEQALILDGTQVKFGETVKTGGSVKEEYLFYHLQFDNPQGGVSESVRNPEDHVCLTEPGIFMRSKLID
nr:hypothetical protein [Psychrobacter sp. PraFG1]UNK05371.1 hypothetical protein MN210_16215 [Psychrobacter sp. PraFG1]